MSEDSPCACPDHIEAIVKTDVNDVGMTNNSRLEIPWTKYNFSFYLGLDGYNIYLTLLCVVV